MDYVFYFASLSQINPPCTRGQSYTKRMQGRSGAGISARIRCTNSAHRYSMCSVESLSI